MDIRTKRQAKTGVIFILNFLVIWSVSLIILGVLDQFDIIDLEANQHNPVYYWPLGLYGMFGPVLLALAWTYYDIKKRGWIK